MSCSCVESAAHLTRSYAAFAKLALAVTANHQSVQFWESLSKSLQNLTDQLSCGSCGNFAALAPHPDPLATTLSPGILCSGCAGRKKVGGAGGAAAGSSSEDESDDDATASALFKSTVSNLSLLCSVLWQDVVLRVGQEEHSSESEEDDEVTFSPVAVASIPPALMAMQQRQVTPTVLGTVTSTPKQIKSMRQTTGVVKTDPSKTPASQLAVKFRQRLKAVCDLLNVPVSVSQFPSSAASTPPTPPVATKAPSPPSVVIRNGSVNTGVKVSSARPAMKGCRCGAATSMPGKLTCCGQRCPCYVKSASCLDCKCRGCRNPHRPNGEKRPYPFNEPVTPPGVGASSPKVVIATTSVVTGTAGTTVHKITYGKFPR